MYLYIAILKYRNFIRSVPLKCNIHFTKSYENTHVSQSYLKCHENLYLTLWSVPSSKSIYFVLKKGIFWILICDYDQGMIRFLRVSEHDGIMTYENIWRRCYSFVILSPRIILLWRTVMKRISKLLVVTEISKISRDTLVPLQRCICNYSKNWRLAIIFNLIHILSSSDDHHRVTRVKIYPNSVACFASSVRDGNYYCPDPQNWITQKVL